MLSEIPALVADVPAPHARIARRAVMCIELDADGKITDIDTVVATPKLSAIDFASLSAPNAASWRDLARAGLQNPSLSSWLWRASAELGSALRRRLDGFVWRRR